MNKRFIYTAVSLITLLCGVSVAFLINQRSFVRGFAGDILIVVFIYSSVKIILKEQSPLRIAAGVLTFALFVEFIQYTGLTKFLNPRSIVTILTLGSTYDPLDIAAYSIGTAIIFFIDSILIHSVKK